jgi:hypothetical protein
MSLSMPLSWTESLDHLEHVMGPCWCFWAGPHRRWCFWAGPHRRWCFWAGPHQLGAGLGSDDLGETLVNVLKEMLFLCCVIMYDDWSVVADVYIQQGQNMCSLGRRQNQK